MSLSENSASHGAWDRGENIIEGNLDVKLPTVWTDEKNRGAKSQTGAESEGRKVRRGEQSQRGEKSEEKRSEERRCRCAQR
jgi:hypothetical protein